MSGRHSGPAQIDPDARDAMTLRSGDIPLEVVAYHPCLIRVDTELIQRAHVDTGIRFAETHFPFDQDRIEEIRQPESVDLCTLRRACAVGQQCQLAAFLA